MALSFAKINGPDWLAQLNKNFETIAAGSVTELASNAEAIAGTSTTKALTPANLAAAVTTHVSAASATVAGKVELATEAEALAGSDTARAVTPAGLGGALNNLDIIAFAGRNGAGACTATGLKVGDVVLGVTGVVAADVGSQGSKFETVITVENQIQQSSATDLSAKVFIALVLRKS